MLGSLTARFTEGAVPILCPQSTMSSGGILRISVRSSSSSEFHADSEKLTDFENRRDIRVDILLGGTAGTDAVAAKAA